MGNLSIGHFVFTRGIDRLLSLVLVRHIVFFSVLLNPATFGLIIVNYERAFI